jgi:hypothetical protein
LNGVDYSYDNERNLNFKLPEMTAKRDWNRIIYIIGVILLIIGSLDPLEGSVLIAAGIALLALSTYLKKDKHRKLFLIFFISVVAGVSFLFYLSSLGGFGGNSSLSWWWGTLILPYPAGWIGTIVLLIIRGVNKRRQTSVNNQQQNPDSV